MVWVFSYSLSGRPSDSFSPGAISVNGVAVIFLGITGSVVLDDVAVPESLDVVVPLTFVSSVPATVDVVVVVVVALGVDVPCVDDVCVDAGAVKAPPASAPNVLELGKLMIRTRRVAQMSFTPAGFTSMSGSRFDLWFLVCVMALLPSLFDRLSQLYFE